MNVNDGTKTNRRNVKCLGKMLMDVDFVVYDSASRNDICDCVYAQEWKISKDLLMLHSLKDEYRL